MGVRTRRLALTEGIAAGFLFGSAAIFIRLTPDLDTFSIVLWRLIIACSALTVILLVFRRKPSFAKPKRDLADLALLGLLLGLHFVFFVSSVKDTTILNATVLVNTTPIFSMFISSFIFKLKPTSFAVIGLAVSFIGLCVIAYAETIAANGNSTMFSPSLKGDLEAVLAAVVEAFYLNYGKRIRSQRDLLSTMLPIYLLALIVVGLLATLFASNAVAIPIRMEILLPLIGLGMLPTAIAHTLYFSSLSNLKSFETATMALLEPIGATLLAISLFHETPALPFIFGAALILVGVLFVVKEERGKIRTREINKTVKSASFQKGSEN